MSELTADTITIAQIRALRHDADPKVRKAARCALGESRGGATAMRRARVRCVEILNARAKELTAETITDEQILAVRREVERLCDAATGDDGAGLPDGHPTRRRARARIVEILNACAKEGK